MKLQLLGPTAVGKTGLSVELAKRMDAEIISSDSRQCYKYMNIGTATPDKDERGGIPHHNLSIIDPAQKDSAANFYNRAKQWEREITAREKTILYVGGSTLHQRCIIQPFDDIPDADEQNIAQIEQQIADGGLSSVYKKLKDVDPKYAAEMDGMNRQRIIRALDVIHQTNQPFSSFHTTDFSQKPNNALVIGLTRDRQKLYNRINKRVDEMFERGLEVEVRSLLTQNYTFQMPGMKTVGYREFEPFQKELISDTLSEKHKNEVAEKIKTQTRRYAKRQLTWFRRWPFIQWFHPDQKEEIMNLIQTEIP